MAWVGGHLGGVSLLAVSLARRLVRDRETVIRFDSLGVLLIIEIEVELYVR